MPQKVYGNKQEKNDSKKKYIIKEIEGKKLRKIEKVPEKKSKVKRKIKTCEMWPNFVAVISLLCLALFAWAQAGPVPIVNEVSTQRSVGSR